MACDDYDDLVELGIEDELSSGFSKASDYVQKNASSMSSEVLLKLYAYYKQATEGKCNTPKPSWYDLRAKSKWEAWNNLRELPQNEAKQLYINIIRELDSSVLTDVSSSKEGWVTVSTLQQNNEEKVESDYEFLDYIKDGNYAKVADLLKNNAIKSEINALDGEGLAAIHWASDRGSYETIKMLLDNGAKVNLQDADGQTALHYAASCGHSECVKVLLSEGADPKLKDSDGSDCFGVACDETVTSLLRM